MTIRLYWTRKFTKGVLAGLEFEDDGCPYPDTMLNILAAESEATIKAGTEMKATGTGSHFLVTAYRIERDPPGLISPLAGTPKPGTLPWPDSLIAHMAGGGA